MPIAPQDPVVHEDRIDYVPTPINVTRARRHAARVVAEWGHPALSDDAALIVSELAGNAVRHGRVAGRLFRVYLTLTKTSLRIAVADPRGERLPQPRQPSPDEKHGRGLLIVRALATRWGVRERTVGKEIWAELDLADSPTEV
ncbi:ATP-binding protein [Streptomyces sp. Rer75]|uniref:ATP-binding protein n=1 Tax=unclassified Streptomyces TaxID=2593676 RepID=UPI0015D06934|nr:ATP-binding protein [Streptomyces sp. Rer75]QLH24226.1 ATP-binding protein [Streptomyces sp. Rer75]